MMRSHDGRLEIEAYAYVSLSTKSARRPGFRRKASVIASFTYSGFHSSKKADSRFHPILLGFLPTHSGENRCKDGTMRVFHLKTGPCLSRQLTKQESGERFADPIFNPRKTCLVTTLTTRPGAA